MKGIVYANQVVPRGARVESEKKERIIDNPNHRSPKPERTEVSISDIRLRDYCLKTKPPTV